MMTIDIGPSQAMCHQRITSRPMSRPKFVGSFGLAWCFAKLNGSVHDPTLRLSFGASVVPMNERSTAYVGFTTMPLAVWEGAEPICTSPRWLATNRGDRRL